jgi:lipopolysaccharide export system permease protein
MAVLVAYNQMINHNEITILKNAGLDKLKLAKPAIYISSICCIICFLISFFLMPYSNKKLRSIRSDFQNNYANLLISPGIFEQLRSLTIYVKTKDNSNHLSGILIYDSRNPDYSTTITSKTGTINEENNLVLLYLKEGTVQRFSYKSKKSDILHFDSYVVNLSDNSNETTIGLKWKASERYINELLNPTDKVSAKDLAEYYVELHQRITYPLLSLVLTLIACAFVLDGKFNRYGNLSHNLKAVFAAAGFVGLMMVSYNLISRKPQFVILLYLIILLFIIISVRILKDQKLVGKKAS